MTRVRLFSFAVLFILPLLSLSACESGVREGDKEICETAAWNDGGYIDRALTPGRSDSEKSAVFAELAAILETQAATAGDDLAGALAGLREEMLKLAADPDAYDTTVQAAYDRVYAACEAVGADWQAAAVATVPPTPSTVYAADTKMRCDKMMTDLYVAAESLGADLGEFITYRQAKETASVEKARIAVRERLMDVATVLRAATEGAKDPGLRAAGEKASDNMMRAAQDDAFFVHFKTKEDANTLLKVKYAVWVAPLEGFCV